MNKVFFLLFSTVPLPLFSFFFLAIAIFLDPIKGSSRFSAFVITWRTYSKILFLSLAPQKFLFFVSVVGSLSFYLP